MSATPKRADRLENMLFWHIGPLGAVGNVRKLRPKITMVRSVVDGVNEQRFMRYGQVDEHLTTEYLIHHGARNRQIARLAAKAASVGRKVVVFSARREHLGLLEPMVAEEMRRAGFEPSIGYFVGGMEQSELDAARRCTIMLATYAMASEGLDLVEFDTVILASPRSNVEQPIGRVLRGEKAREVLVLDLVDPISICRRMQRSRMRLYERKNWIGGVPRVVKAG